MFTIKRLLYFCAAVSGQNDLRPQRYFGVSSLNLGRGNPAAFFRFYAENDAKTGGEPKKPKKAAERCATDLRRWLFLRRCLEPPGMLHGLFQPSPPSPRGMAWHPEGFLYGNAGSRGWVRSSAGEHYLDMVGVTGSIPVAPTTTIKDLVVVFCKHIRSFGWDVGWENLNERIYVASSGSLAVGVSAKRCKILSTAIGIFVGKSIAKSLPRKAFVTPYVEH